MRVFNNRLATENYQPKPIARLGPSGSLDGRTGTKRNFNHENQDRST